MTWLASSLEPRCAGKQTPKRRARYFCPIDHLPSAVSRSDLAGAASATFGFVRELADSGRDEQTTRDASDSSQIPHIDGDIVTAAFAVRLGRGGATQTY
jgi:hypothetical protein